MDSAVLKSYNYSTITKYNTTAFPTYRIMLHHCIQSWAPNIPSIPLPLKRMLWMVVTVQTTSSNWSHQFIGGNNVSWLASTDDDMSNLSYLPKNIDGQSF